VHDHTLNLVFSVVRRYFWWKSLVNFCVSILIVSWLSIFIPNVAFDVAALSFFLLFIPVVADFVPFLLPIPLMIFDVDVGSYDYETLPESLIMQLVHPIVTPIELEGVDPILSKVSRRFAVSIIAELGMGVIHMIRQFVEPPILARAQRWSQQENESDETESKGIAITEHPVLILFVVNVCGQVWGPIGMLISVPVLWLGLQLKQQSKPDGDLQIHELVSALGDPKMKRQRTR